jgi:hypothetical protein
MVAREHDRDRAREIAANRQVKALLAQRPARYRRLAAWLSDCLAAAGRRLQTWRAANEIASE